MEELNNVVDNLQTTEISVDFEIVPKEIIEIEFVIDKNA